MHDSPSRVAARVCVIASITLSIACVLAFLAYGALHQHALRTFWQWGVTPQGSVLPTLWIVRLLGALAAVPTALAGRLLGGGGTFPRMVAVPLALVACVLAFIQF